MKHVLFAFCALSLTACASTAPSDTTKLRAPSAWMLAKTCTPPPIPANDGDPRARSEWYAENRRCWHENRTKARGLQSYARAVSK